MIDAEFVERYQIDYVAHDEDPYVSAGHEDVYDFVKRVGARLFIHLCIAPHPDLASILGRQIHSHPTNAGRIDILTA